MLHPPGQEISRALMEDRKQTAVSYIECFQNWLSRLSVLTTWKKHLFRTTRLTDTSVLQFTRDELLCHSLVQLALELVTIIGKKRQNMVLSKKKGYSISRSMFCCLDNHLTFESSQN